MKAPSPELTARIEQHMAERGRRLYQPILHPAFSHIGYQNGPERLDLIEPHLEHKNGTVLDIGSQWGYVAHRLEDLGYKVTAVEASRVNAYFLTELRDLCGKRFEIIRDSVFNLAETKYDIVFALNIFHHFMKTEPVFRQFETLLSRLKCRMMIYQAHIPSEKQMSGAYRNMAPEEATQFLSERLSLPRVTRIGTYRKGREIFKLAEGDS